MIHLDTHIAAWLYAGERRRFSASVTRRIEREVVCISPAVELELQLLFEVGRTRQAAREVVSDLAARIGLRISEASFRAIVEAAAGLTWTRDPFDRMIVGNAHADRATLLTADETILENFRGAAWG